MDWLRRQSTHSLLLSNGGVASYSDMHSFGEGKSVAAVSGRETHIHSPRSVPVLEEEQHDSAESNIHSTLIDFIEQCRTIRDSLLNSTCLADGTLASDSVMG